MKRIYSFLISGTLVLSLFYSCTKEELAKYDGQIYGKVTDYSTNEPLQNVTVVYPVNGQYDSVMTDTNGKYMITGLKGGDFPVIFKKSGYAQVKNNIYIETLGSYPATSKGGTITYRDRYDAKLPSLSATVKGIIQVHLGPNNELRPAANYPYRLVINNNNIWPNMFTGTTNSSGEFTITGVPATDYGYLYVGPKTEGTGYYFDDFYTDLVKNDTTFVSNDIYPSTGTHSYLVSSNVDSAGYGVSNFHVSDNITLNFSRNVSHDLTVSFGGYVYLTGYGYLNLDTQVSFTNNSVIINPPSDLSNSTNYTLYYVIYSTIPGDVINGTIHFRTEN